MAQHIPIKAFKQKAFRKIEEAIIRDFQGYFKTSMKYWRENDEDIYYTTRHIGKGFVYGSTRGDFEIHYDSERQVIKEIYLVA